MCRVCSVHNATPAPAACRAQCMCAVHAVRAVCTAQCVCKECSVCNVCGVCPAWGRSVNPCTVAVGMQCVQCVCSVCTVHTVPLCAAHTAHAAEACAECAAHAMQCRAHCTCRCAMSMRTACAAHPTCAVCAQHPCSALRAGALRVRRVQAVQHVQCGGCSMYDAGSACPGAVHAACAARGVCGVRCTRSVCSECTGPARSACRARAALCPQRVRLWELLAPQDAPQPLVGCAVAPRGSGRLRVWPCCRRGGCSLGVPQGEPPAGAGVLGAAPWGALRQG